MCVPAFFVSNSHDVRTSGSFSCCAAHCCYISDQRERETCWDFRGDSEHSSVMKRSQGRRCMTGVSHLKKAEQRLKICGDYIYCKENNGQRLWDFQLVIDFLIEQQTINAAFCSKRPSKVSLSFKMTRSISQKHLSPPGQQEYWTKCIGRYCHTPPIVLIWRQAIFTFKVYSQRP
jgi:hypothetical protein